MAAAAAARLPAAAVGWRLWMEEGGRKKTLA
jgi:hypothetical protein